MPNTSDVYTHIGKRLKDLRLARKMTQAQIAEVVGVSPQQYQKYEEAHSKSSVAMLMALSSFYGVQYESFLPGWEENKNSAIAEGGLSETRAKSGNDRQSDRAFSTLNEDPLVSRLVSAYLQIPDQDERTRLVELVEAMMKAHRD